MIVDEDCEISCPSPLAKDKTDWFLGCHLLLPQRHPRVRRQRHHQEARPLRCPLLRIWTSKSFSLFQVQGLLVILGATFSHQIIKFNFQCHFGTLKVSPSIVTVGVAIHNRFNDRNSETEYEVRDSSSSSNNNIYQPSYFRLSTLRLTRPTWRS